MKKLGIIVVASLAFMGAVVADPAVSTPTAQAKTKVSVVSKKSMSTTKYQIDQSKAKGAYAYSSNLKKKEFKLSSGHNSVFYAKSQEKIKVGKSTRVYYYIKSSTNSKLAGWVWHGYLVKPILSKSAVAKLVASGQDLNPSSTLLKQPSAFYSTYRSYLEKEFNMTGKLTHFKNHQARVWIADPNLKTYADTAMGVWNKALGRKVFVTGSSKNFDLVISSRPSKQWDGLNDGIHLYLSSTALNDKTYMDSVADTPEIRALYNQYENVAEAYKDAANGSAEKAAYLAQGHTLYDQLIAAQKAAAPSATSYWEGVTVHELGHSLGLDHTPYLTDIMYAETSNDGFSSSVNGKYSWNSPKDPNDTRRETPTLSARDVNRAKLGMELGYW
ncbi:matrixin family metalloprotease [Lactobacillus sp. LC28-10]|uniref:Matrixin family metalloprotease n=1 Tax=Secundilactobacillus angelensis TaxID=2722706 RepID=A0ABX1KVM7_9LACO|nr:matrixin family metalloprotease [Secundilactobacillus angelensis]MCH5461661.1 matrixin family metalloprotease [Secundilactobacillus angelensis]NLR17956.1 matrixin family metalloprotease [Secundilactobacillus angelensis]